MQDVHFIATWITRSRKRAVLILINGRAHGFIVLGQRSLWHPQTRFPFRVTFNGAISELGFSDLFGAYPADAQTIGISGNGCANIRDEIERVAVFFAME